MSGSSNLDSFRDRRQVAVQTGCSPEDLPEAMNDMEKWRERFRDIPATSTTL